MATVEKLKNVEFNNQIKAELDIGQGGTEEWGDMTQAFKSISQALNETTYAATYLCDDGYGSTIVTGMSPTLNLTGDFIKTDPVCEYLDDIQYEIGDKRVSKMKLTRNGKVVTCPVTITNIAIAFGESAASNSVSVTINFNGKPTVGSASSVSLSDG